MSWGKSGECSWRVGQRVWFGYWNIYFSPYLARREKGERDSYGSTSAVHTVLYLSTCQRGCCVGVLWIIEFCGALQLGWSIMGTSVAICILLFLPGHYCFYLNTTVATCTLLFLPGYFYFYLVTTVSNWIQLFHLDTTVSTWIPLYIPGYYCLFMQIEEEEQIGRHCTSYFTE